MTGLFKGPETEGAWWWRFECSREPSEGLKLSEVVIGSDIRVRLADCKGQRVDVGRLIEIAGSSADRRCDVLDQSWQIR